LEYFLAGGQMLEGTVLKYSVMGAAVMLALASPASAADMLGDANLRGFDAPPSRYPTLSTTQNWSGAYIGAYGAVPVHSDMNARPGPLTSPFISGSYKSTVTGGGGGVLAGYNLQEGNIVFGGEADLGLYQMKARESQIAGATTFDSKMRADYLATLRGRIGYGIGPVLLYATAGGAATRLKGSVSTTLGGLPQFSYDSTRTVYGYAVGGGIEYAVSNGFNVRAEYLYTAFNRVNYADVAQFKLNAGFARLAIISQF
jgi:outer membrane immunogenic protein